MAARRSHFAGLPQPDPFRHRRPGGRGLLERIREEPLPADTILNVNVPDLPWHSLRGFQSARLGQRHKAEPVIRTHDPRGREIYWVGAAGPEQDAGPGTDFHAIRNGYVAVTPLQIDLTSYERLQTLADWLPKGEML